MQMRTRCRLHKSVFQSAGFLSQSLVAKECLLHLRTVGKSTTFSSTTDHVNVDEPYYFCSSLINTLIFVSWYIGFINFNRCSGTRCSFCSLWRISLRASLMMMKSTSLVFAVGRKFICVCRRVLIQVSQSIIHLSCNHFKKMVSWNGVPVIDDALWCCCLRRVVHRMCRIRLRAFLRV